VTQVERSLAGDAALVRVSGRLDATGAAALEAELNEAVRAGARKLRLDLSGVTFLSSAGIRVLFRSQQALARLGGELGVTDASDAVRHVLRLSGVDRLLGAFGETATAPAPATVVAGIPGQVHVLPGGPVAGRLVGDPSRLPAGAFDAASTASLAFPPGTLGLGLGAFGEGFDDCRGRFGEFLAAGGAAACLPTDGSEPDDVVAHGDLVPTVRALYGLAAEGGFSRLLRFEADPSAGPVPFSRLVAAALQLAGEETVAFAVVAETAGLLGAALRRSPVGAGDLFAFPAVREALSFTAERVHERATALVVGVASAAGGTALEPFLRPAGSAPLPAVHAHAAAFTFRALPAGAPPFYPVVRGLFEEERLLALLHLLPDAREISGAGESLFLAGALWTAPLRLAAKDGGAA
jgi:anti-anti-sigma factor